MNQSMRFAIIGPGAVGGFLAAALFRSGMPVLVVARESTCQVITEHGLEMESRILGDFRADIQAVSTLDEPVDFLLVCPKEPALSQSMERITGQAATSRLVVPFLNGLPHMTLLEEKFPGRVAAGAIYIESMYMGPGRIKQTSEFAKVHLARHADAEAISLLADALEASGIKVEILPSDQDVLWRKLVPLNALACTTTAFDCTIGDIRSNPDKLAALVACLEEGARVAALRGVEISIPPILESLAQLPDSFTTSMHRDLQAGRPPELRAIPEALLGAGQETGVSCPTVEDLVDRIRRLLQITLPR